MDSHKEIITQIELHSVVGIRDCFLNGVNPNDNFKGAPLIYELLSEYLRGDSFKECIRIFVEFGLEFEDHALLAVLLDDSHMLQDLINENPNIVNNNHTFRSAYTPILNASLLHICAEFNHINCAKVLVENGFDVNTIAGIDEYGFGGQTAVFHTVNQNRDQSKDMLDFLLDNSADLSITLKGLVWGKGYEWETFIPAINPISYAMMGLLPQMHRNEKTIAETVSKLLKYSYGIDYTPKNIPNKYLQN